MNDTIWQHAPHVAWTEAGGCVYLLALDGRHLAPRALEGSGSQIWLQIDGLTRVEGVIASLADAYGVEADVIGPQVSAFIDDLSTLGVLVPIEVGAR